MPLCSACSSDKPAEAFRRRGPKTEPLTCNDCHEARRRKKKKRGRTRSRALVPAAAAKPAPPAAPTFTLRAGYDCEIELADGVLRLTQDHPEEDGEIYRNTIELLPFQARQLLLRLQQLDREFTA